MKILKLYTGIHQSMVGGFISDFVNYKYVAPGGNEMHLREAQDGSP
jgi:hypothetical protein